MSLHLTYSSFQVCAGMKKHYSFLFCLNYGSDHLMNKIWGRTAFSQICQRQRGQSLGHFSEVILPKACWFRIFNVFTYQKFSLPEQKNSCFFSILVNRETLIQSLEKAILCFPPAGDKLVPGRENYVLKNDAEKIKTSPSYWLITQMFFKPTVFWHQARPRR